jgi:hypothetical protein
LLSVTPSINTFLQLNVCTKLGRSPPSLASTRSAVGTPLLAISYSLLAASF